MYNTGGRNFNILDSQSGLKKGIVTSYENRSSTMFVCSTCVMHNIVCDYPNDERSHKTLITLSSNARCADNESVAM